MKSKNLLIVLILTGLLTACASSVSTFYQVFKANGDGLVKTGNSLVFEDENCIVSYNLWSEGGNIGFRFYNKTDQNIFLNLDECFLVFNGNAYNYFKNRTYAFSSGTGVEITSGLGGTTSVVGSNSVTGINYLSFLQTDAVSIGGTQSMYFSGSSNVSKGYAVTFNEEKIVCIPSKTAKIINEYSINKTPYRDCDLLRFPSGKETAEKTFEKQNSPYVFSNRIVFRIGQSEAEKKIENGFYISEITNLSLSKMTTREHEVFCGQKDDEKTTYFKEAPPDEFYVTYKKTESSFWHH